MAFGIVYGLYHPLTGEIRYIGQTTQTLKKRLQAHLSSRNLQVPKYSAHWLAKLCRLGLEPKIAELGMAGSSYELDRLEIEQIALARAAGARLTNHTDGGSGQRGRKVSDDSRAKMSASHKGKPNPSARRPCATETRVKISEKLRGQYAGASSHHWRHVSMESISQKLAEGKTLTQVAVDLGISDGTLRNRIRLARATGVGVPKPKRTSWNKGLNRTTSESVRLGADRRRGATRTAEARARMSLAKKGHPRSRVEGST